MEGLLDDNLVARYLRDGFVVLEPGELDADFHAGMFDAACGVHDEARVVGGDSVHLQIIGDNLRARIPGVERLLASPTVQGSLTSVLGDGYYLHPHHFVHESTPRDQAFHQDGNLPWNDRSHYRTHRPNWSMLFYYPQAVADDNGPTEILPGTQYWTTNFEKADGTWHRGDALVKDARSADLASDDPARRERHIRQGVESLGIAGIRRHRIRVPAGAVVVAHYDLMRLCDADLSTLARIGLSDHDRYVRGLAAVILEHHARARGGSWMAAFVEHLTRARFNHRPPRRASA